MNKPINVAIASYGLSGKIFHAPFLMTDARFRVLKVLERSKNLSEKEIPGSSVVRSYGELIHDPAVEMVVVNTPNQLHFEMTRQALENGKHVIVEKPFTTTVAEAEELSQLAKKKGLVLAVFQNRRFDVDFLTVKKVIEDKVLGNIKLFESQIYRWKPEQGNKLWKIEPLPASGLLYDLGSHLIDQALVLFGKPKSIFADLDCFRKDGKVDDYFEVIFYYDDKRVHLKSFLLSAINEPRFTAYGDLATYRKLGPDLQEPTLMSGVLPTDNNWDQIYKNQGGKIYKGDGNIDIEPVKTDYRYYFSNVFDAIRKGAELIVKPEEAIDIIKIIELAIISDREKRVVNI